MKSTRWGNLLPLLLFSSSFLPLINGQFGQPTILGFAVLVTGLALAAQNDSAEESEIAATVLEKNTPAPQRIVGRRSPYADRLHGPDITRPQNNGAADR